MNTPDLNQQNPGVSLVGILIISIVAGGSGSLAQLATAPSLERRIDGVEQSLVLATHRLDGIEDSITKLVALETARYDRLVSRTADPDPKTEAEAD